MLQWRYEDRAFQVWTYTVSHAQLLLRSTKRSASDRRVEVLFKNVGAMNIVPLLENLEIRQCAMEALGAPLLPAIGHGRTAYAIRARDFTGWVVAGAAVVHEDDGEYDAPSSIFVGGLSR